MEQTHYLQYKNRGKRYQLGFFRAITDAFRYVSFTSATTFCLPGLSPFFWGADLPAKLTLRAPPFGEAPFSRSGGGIISPLTLPSNSKGLEDKQPPGGSYGKNSKFSLAAGSKSPPAKKLKGFKPAVIQGVVAKKTTPPLISSSFSLVMNGYTIIKPGDTPFYFECRKSKTSPPTISLAGSDRLARIATTASLPAPPNTAGQAGNSARVLSIP